MVFPSSRAIWIRPPPSVAAWTTCSAASKTPLLFVSSPPLGRVWHTNRVVTVRARQCIFRYTVVITHRMSRRTATIKYPQAAEAGHLPLSCAAASTHQVKQGRPQPDGTDRSNALQSRLWTARSRSRSAPLDPAQWVAAARRGKRPLGRSNARGCDWTAGRHPFRRRCQRRESGRPVSHIPRQRALPHDF